MATHAVGSTVHPLDGSTASSVAPVGAIPAPVVATATVVQPKPAVTQMKGSNVVTNDLELVQWKNTPIFNLQVASGFSN